MKIGFVPFLVVISLTYGAGDAHAYTPEIPLPLKSRVWLSTHIFVATPTKIELVDERGQSMSTWQYSQKLEAIKKHMKNGNRSELTSDQLFAQIYLKYQMNVKRMLYPIASQSEQTVIFRYSYNFAPYGLANEDVTVKAIEDSLRRIGKDQVGHPRVFLMVRKTEGKSNYFVSVQANYYEEGLRQERTIRSLIRGRLRWEKKQKKGKKNRTTKAGVLWSTPAFVFALN